jgi:hypothetical protein
MSNMKAAAIIATTLRSFVMAILLRLWSVADGSFKQRYRRQRPAGDSCRRPAE